MTLCAKCRSDVGYEAGEGVAVTCSRCVNAKCLRLERGDKAQRATLEPDTVKRLRKDRGYTQADLALVLRLPVLAISEFERGLRLPDKALFDWATAEE